MLLPPAQTCNEWGSVLKVFNDEERRAFAGLALPTEGFKVSSLPNLGLRRMLKPLTKPVAPGSPLRTFSSSYHRGALMVGNSHMCMGGDMIKGVFTYRSLHGRHLHQVCMDGAST